MPLGFSLRALSLTAFLIAVAAAADVVRFNVGGPYIPSIGFREDVSSLRTPPDNSVALAVSPAVISISGSWRPVYSTYRYAASGDLVYKFPAPPGSFDISLLFLESWAGAANPGVRVFSLSINGDTKIPALDVAKAVGFQKPLYVKINSIASVSAFITVTLGRIPGKNNPMLSAIVLAGNDVSAEIGNLGFTSTSPTTAVTNPPITTSSVATSLNPPDPTCARGKVAKNNFTGQIACCPDACPKCGGSGCGTAAPGNLCCISSISAQKISCTDQGPPCIPSDTSSEPTVTDPTCPSPSILGINKGNGQTACCEKECGKCGGSGCGSFAPGKLCCISNVYNSGKSCASNAPPCIPVSGSVGVTTAPPPVTLPPTTAAPIANPGCPVSGATTNSFRMNAAGAALAGAQMGADNPAYISSSDKGLLSTGFGAGTISAKNDQKPWDSAYTSHRWTKASVLTYKIPVPPGSYTAKLMFAETYFDKVGARTFDIYINGVELQKDLDVFKTVGKNVGLLLSFPNILPNAGAIAITLIKTVENPMISGIMIEGAGAGSRAIGGGCLDDDDEENSGELNGGFNHRSHSVPGGPYIATDFDKNGKSFVSLDGTQSHSHYNDPGPPEVVGKIVSYKWTWKEIVDGKEVSKENNNKSGMFTAAFPLGKTTITLEVVDSTGDVASDSAIVEVKESTANGAYCYYYDFKDDLFATVPLPIGLNSIPKPLYGAPSAVINFKSAADFPKVTFSANAFAVRCMFYLKVANTGAFSYTIEHEGPFRLYHSDVILSQSNSRGTTKSPSKNLLAGLNAFQLHYFRPKNLAPVLVLSDANGPLSSSILQHDSSATLPVISGLSKTSSSPDGGENLQIYGSGFINGVSVKFGDVEASNLISSDPGTVQVTVPPGLGIVTVTVSTNAGISNGFVFSYTSDESLNQPVIFKETKLQDQSGSLFEISLISTATYGPDGRLYLASAFGRVYALSIDSEYKVSSRCEKQLGSNRAVLGATFSPFSNNLKMFFTTNTLYWKDRSLLSFEEGWPNGKVETIEFSRTQLSGGNCAFNQQVVVTGLPVSNHDHGVNKLQFLPNGELLIGVGGFTNGGISVPGKKPVANDAPDDGLGGVGSNPLSAAIVSCPANKKTNIVYDNYVNPEEAKIISGNDCKVYASGFRNSYGMTLHTNGKLYATDNGPNAGFGEFSTDCNGGQKKAANIADRFYLVEKGRHHGHANLNRGECVNYPSSAVKPLVDNLKSSSNGIIEYRSNTFGGEIKGNIYISKFSVQGSGLIGQVKLGTNGGADGIGYAPNFLGFSGLSLVEGPRGEFVMPRYQQKHVVIAFPSYKSPSVTFMLGVHPKQGPSFGGTKVLISGHNFGSSPTAKFGGTACTNVVVIDDSSFTCVTPAKPKNSQVSVVVSGTIGSSPNYGSDYWYF